MFNVIKRSLSLKLCLGILGFVVVVFVCGLGFLFVRSQQIVRQEAMERATQMLDNTELRVVTYLDEVEAATENINWLVLSNLRRDSLEVYTHRVVEQNPNINGCSITMEPGFFPEHGRNFSVYTVRLGYEIETAVEEDYDYYSKIWYNTPKERNKECWVDPYNDFNEGTLSSPVMITSYCKPLRNPAGEFIGVMATDLSIEWLSKTISAEKPYPHSYWVMLGSDGRYFVHPNQYKLIQSSIFTSFNEKEHPDVIAVGKEMTEGKNGNARIFFDGKPYLAFYRPVENTGWSIALVCSEDDIFAGYSQINFILIPLILIGLLLMLFVCWKTINHFIAPVDQLAKESKLIAEGNFSKRLPKSDRDDVVGGLQNSFVKMQESTDNYISNIQQVNTETKQRNNELAKANELAKETEKNKVDFIREILMQIRTPLNIIAGFMQVMGRNFRAQSPEELEKSIDAMKQNATTVKRMASMLLDASWRGELQALDLSKPVDVNTVLEDSIRDFHERAPHDVLLNYTSTLPKPHYIHSNRLYLHRTIREILYNAKKFASGKPVDLMVDATDEVVRVVIEDHGPGIPVEDRERVFEPFFKHDNFSEGLGLGLGLTRVNIKKLNGAITLDPEYTEGVRFILEVPNK